MLAENKRIFEEDIFLFLLMAMMVSYRVILDQSN